MDKGFIQSLYRQWQGKTTAALGLSVSRLCRQKVFLLSLSKE